MKLPTLTTRSFGHELDARLGELARRAEAALHERSRGNAGMALACGAAAITLFVVVTGESSAFSHAAFPLVLFGLSLCMLTGARLWRLFGAFGVVLACMFLLGGGDNFLNALDLRAHPGVVFSMLLLSICGVGGLLRFAASRHAAHHGVPNEHMLRYVAAVAAPLLNDTSPGVRGQLELAAHEPQASHWQMSVQGNLHTRSLERLVLDVRVPLDERELFSLRVDERIESYTKITRNMRGRTKQKPKGIQREIIAQCEWTLHEAAADADLTAALTSHLHARNLRTSHLRLNARQSKKRLHVTLRTKLRSPNDYDAPREWIDARILHEAARFLADVRRPMRMS